MVFGGDGGDTGFGVEGKVFTGPGRSSTLLFGFDGGGGSSLGMAFVVLVEPDGPWGVDER